MKKLSNRFWIILVAAILVISAAATAYIYLRPSAQAPGDTAVVYLDGEMLTPGTDYIAEDGSTKITVQA